MPRDWERSLLEARAELSGRVIAQVVGLLRDVWQTAGLDVYVDPYGVLPTKYECGIIQVGLTNGIHTLMGRDPLAASVSRTASGSAASAWAESRAGCHAAVFCSFWRSGMAES